MALNSNESSALKLNVESVDEVGEVIPNSALMPLSNRLHLPTLNISSLSFFLLNEEKQLGQCSLGTCFW